VLDFVVVKQRRLTGEVRRWILLSSWHFRRDGSLSLAM
jgi:hypothetical protein